MSPDLKQNLFYTLYFIFLHNFSAIFYFTGIIFSAALLFFKPTRWKALLLFGFIILLFAFEYNKHIVEPLKEQTINSLITVRQHYKTQKAVNLVLVKVLPVLLPLSGWFLVFTGLYLRIKEIKKTRKLT